MKVKHAWRKDTRIKRKVFLGETRVSNIFVTWHVAKKLESHWMGWHWQWATSEKMRGSVSLRHDFLSSRHRRLPLSLCRLYKYNSTNTTSKVSSNLLLSFRLFYLRCAYPSSSPPCFLSLPPRKIVRLITCCHKRQSNEQIHRQWTYSSHLFIISLNNKRC